ncbi:hypothetical protein ACB288_04305 [Aeromonas taiwanensis]
MSKMNRMRVQKRLACGIDTLSDSGCHGSGKRRHDAIELRHPF